MTIDIEHSDGICILRCKGRLASGPELEYMQARLEHIKVIACRRLLADFSEVSSIGSMGVGFLVAVFTSVMRNGGGRFILTGVQPFVRQVLEITRLDTVIPMARDVASGLETLSAEAAPV
ncbi:MAG TPA: STAS domain-containing protein [Bryobacteraceae bacterium]|nr:STAS domain-containing protein [Bryobacteraceae bacterium]HUO29645.1 STAS domain-containing protein [Bryobacteraceae bacterium]